MNVCCGYNNVMKYTIGIDARCLEGNRTGTGRYLFNLLRHFGQSADFSFYLYFKHEIPVDAYFQEYAYKLQRLEPSLGFESNAYFTHVQLPAALKRDRVAVLFAPAYIAPWNSPVPTVVALHDISYSSHPEWTNFQGHILLGAVSKHAARKAAHVITISQFSKREIMRVYGITEDRITITPLASDVDLVREIPDAERTAVLEKLGVGGNFIFSVGNLINRRYPAQTLEAFFAVARKIPTLQLVLVGVDRTHPSLGIAQHVECINKALGRFAVRPTGRDSLQAVVHLAHASDKELAVLYHASKALVWLSSYEGFGLPPLEAMAVGTPVITSNTSSLPEVVGDAAIKIGEPAAARSSTGGISVSVGPSVGSIADAMHRVLTDETLRNWLIAKGKARAQQFSWKTAADATLEVFRRILE